MVESSMENDRVRVFTICFYLEDNSLDISERKDMNSGIMQGKFLKRHMVLIYIYIYIYIGYINIG